jgi:methionine aminopeptidase
MKFGQGFPQKQQKKVGESDFVKIKFVSYFKGYHWESTKTTPRKGENMCKLIYFDK